MPQRRAGSIPAPRTTFEKPMIKNPEQFIARSVGIALLFGTAACGAEISGGDPGVGAEAVCTVQSSSGEGVSSAMYALAASIGECATKRPAVESRYTLKTDPNSLVTHTAKGGRVVLKVTSSSKLLDGGPDPATAKDITASVYPRGSRGVKPSYTVQFSRDEKEASNWHMAWGSRDGQSWRSAAVYDGSLTTGEGRVEHIGAGQERVISGNLIAQVIRWGNMPEGGVVPDPQLPPIPR